MRDYGASGYIVPVENFKLLLSPDIFQQFEELTKNSYETEELTSFLNTYLPKWLPPFDLYCPADEDNVEEPLEIGKWYAIFSDDDLFTKIPKTSYEQLKRSGIEPVFVQWTVWG